MYHGCSDSSTIYPAIFRVAGGDELATSNLSLPDLSSQGAYRLERAIIISNQKASCEEGLATRDCWTILDQHAHPLESTQSMKQVQPTEPELSRSVQRFDASSPAATRPTLMKLLYRIYAFNLSEITFYAIVLVNACGTIEKTMLLQRHEFSIQRKLSYVD